MWRSRGCNHSSTRRESMKKRNEANQGTEYDNQDKPSTSDRSGGERPACEIVLYESTAGRVQVDVRLDGDTVWLTQLQIAELLDTTQQNVNFHLVNVLLAY